MKLDRNANIQSIILTGKSGYNNYRFWKLNTQFSLMYECTVHVLIIALLNDPLYQVRKLLIESLVWQLELQKEDQIRLSLITLTAVIKIPSPRA